MITVVHACYVTNPRGEGFCFSDSIMYMAGEWSVMNEELIAHIREVLERTRKVEIAFTSTPTIIGYQKGVLDE